MAVVIVDGQEIELADGERLNGIQAARRAGVEIPHYCWHPGLSVVASCRMCLVETGTRDAQTGKVSMLPKLVPACQTPATPNTVFVTNSDKVRQSRAYVEECLLIDHPVDCPICDKAGECHLQDYHFEHGQKERRADIRPFHSRRREMGETVTLFVDRCVMCTRCVRFCREISGTSELMVIDRGSHDEIDVFPGYPLANKLSGNVVDLCPVGALGDKDFLYSQRVWFMKQHAGVCAGCATGCSITVEENQDQVYRLKPRENPHVNGWWMCDEGRFGFHHIHSEKRLQYPQRQGNAGPEPVDWSTVTAQLPDKLAQAGRLAGLVSPHLTVEEAYLLCAYLRSVDPTALLALGPVPIEGTDESFKNGFTIRAEKCPNRRGVEEVLRHFQSTATGNGSAATRTVPQAADVAAAVQRGDVGGLWVAGGYKTDWLDQSLAESLAAAPLLIVQDLFPSPLSQWATYCLPGASFAERAGSYVNFQGRLQTAEWAIRPPAGVRTEGSLFWQLLKRPGLYQQAAVLAEAAQAIGYFASARDGAGALGVELNPAAKPTEPMATSS